VGPEATNGATILSMRLRVLICAFFALAAISAAGQTAAGIHLVDVRFDGDTQLKGVDLGRCAADLRSREYEGPEWLANLAERVQGFCLEEKGYFKALVTPSGEQLPDKYATHQFVVTFNIHAGQQYRTGDITFTNNHVFSTGELRSMFKLKSGDVFSPARIRRGIEQMRNAYAARGYRDFTPVPDYSLNDSNGVISLMIYCGEGKQAH